MFMQMGTYHSASITNLFISILDSKLRVRKHAHIETSKELSNRILHLSDLSNTVPRLVFLLRLRPSAAACRHGIDRIVRKSVVAQEVPYQTLRDQRPHGDWKHAESSSSLKLLEKRLFLRRIEARTGIRAAWPPRRQTCALTFKLRV